MKYKVKKGVIISENGVPCLPRWFCDDLVAFEIDKFGVSKVQYFNMTTRGSENVFIDDMWGGIRFYVEDRGFHYSQNITHCEVMPYGFKGEWNYKGYVFLYEQRALNNCIVIKIRPKEEIAESLGISMEFYDNFCMLPRKDGDTRYISNVKRIWNGWKYDGEYLKNSFREEDGETHIAINSENTEYIRRDVAFPKNILLHNLNKQEVVFVIAFDSSEEKVKNRAADTLKNLDTYISEQNARYKRVIEKMPVLESPYKELNNFFMLAPLYHESCKVLSVSGGIRAKTQTYWIWGWDGMSSSFAYAYWGDAEFLEKLLTFYMETADSEKGIGHNFARDLSHIQTSMISAQGFYISLLYQYYLNGGNIEPYYDFAKKIYGLILSTESQKSGLCKGNSLIPDFRETILENGNDLSCFNNSSTYCAVRAMESLAKCMNDNDTYLSAKEFADRMKNAFSDILYDENKGFFCSSADADTLEQRKVYMSSSIKWDNLFCYDLVKEHQSEILKFFEENFVCECGILYTSVLGKAYDADANQMHCYWPANSECYARLINLENRSDLIEQFISWISCWTNILTCPEGIDCYDNVNKPKPDGWSSLNGAWQAYSMRAWYEATVHSVIGIDFAENGMNIYPHDSKPMSIKKLHYRNRIFDVYIDGSGSEIDTVILNGENLGAVRHIDFERFNDKNIVKIIKK